MLDGPYVGFLDLLKTNVTNYIGAVLVTDFSGVPVEFRCTHPVKPTEIQRQLYGSTLPRYVGVELCGKPLLNSIQKKPTLVFVNQELLLGVREKFNAPVLFVRAAGEVLTVEDASTQAKEMRFDAASFASISVKTQCPGDLEEARQHIESLIRNLDPTEPFERIAKAVEALTKENRQFQ